MAVPDPPPPSPPAPYGAFTGPSADGRYWFEWTPFTPAIVAWRNAQEAMGRAVTSLDAASTITGFGIPGLEDDHARFVEALRVLAHDVNDSALEAHKVVDGLEAANASYAASNEASAAEYLKLSAAIAQVLSAQGR